MANKLVIIILSVLIAGTIFFIAFRLYPFSPVISSEDSIGLSNDVTPQFSFYSNRAGKISYSGDCTSSTTSAVRGNNTITFNELEDGKYSNCQITVTIGEKQSVIDIPEFTIDSSKPSTIADSNSYVNGKWVKNVIITFTCNDTGTGCNNTYYKVNGSSEEAGGLVVFNKEGIYALEYWSRDKAGNEETHHTEFDNIRIYESVPTPVLITVSGYKKAMFDIEYTPANSNDNCYYILGSGLPQEYGICSGKFENISLGDGKYEIVVFENNSLGRFGNSGVLTITWDATAPIVTINTPTAGTYNEITWPGVDLNYYDAEICEHSSDGSTWSNFSSCSSPSYTPSAGEQTLYVRGIDGAENIGNATYVTFTYT